jgi:hypothetical protein
VGGGDLVLVTPPSREHEARAVAFLLERSDLRPRVVVRPETPAGPVPVKTPVPVTAKEERGEAPYASSVDLPVPATGYLGPVIRFGQGHRAIYVEVPELEDTGQTGPEGPSPGAASARSGAYLGRPRASGDLFDPIRVLASRLNIDARETRATFLEANGLSVERAYDARHDTPETTPGMRPARPRPPGGATTTLHWGRTRS